MFFFTFYLDINFKFQEHHCQINLINPPPPIFRLLINAHNLTINTKGDL